MSIEHLSLSEIRQQDNMLRFSRGVLTFVVGMQFGSEAKGSIVNYLAPVTSIAVRTGAANAGHTIYHDGTPHVMRQLPASWTNPHTELVIGSGALISPDVLLDEIDRFETYIPIKNRLKIDANAHIITNDQIIDESKKDLSERIGSTSSRSHEGIGVAMADKVLRESRVVQAKDFDAFKPYIDDTVNYLNNQLDRGVDVLVEGTQGYGLSIDHGDFPYVTSRNVTVSALADSIGVNASHFRTNIIGVTRSYPIRVNGNSGPFASGSQEVSWDDMKNLSQNKHLKPEKTSVTGLQRRIATFSEEQYLAACKVNRPTEIALTFADYIDPDIYGRTEISSGRVLDFANKLESLYPAPVTLINTGPTTRVDFDYYRNRMLKKLS